MTSPASLSGAVLLGHGSRESGTEAEIRALCGDLSRTSPEDRFAHAFLNQEPRLESAVETLIEAGCARIRVLPLLVFTGKHILEDVPREIESLRARHPSVHFELKPYLARLPGFREVLENALGLKNAPNPPVPEGTPRS